MGAEAPGAGGRRAAGALGARSPPPASSRPTASRSSAAPRTPRRANAQWKPTASRSRRCSSSGGALPGRGHPARLLHRRAGAGDARRSSASACRCRSASQWLSIVPIAASRSSYNGLLVFLFIAHARGIARGVSDPSLRLRRLRRAPAWDCGYPDASPATQYTAMSFAQPIRRVFGTVVFSAREHVEMPPPGDTRPARLTVTLSDPVWDSLYAPLARRVGFARRPDERACSS